MCSTDRQLVKHISHLPQWPSVLVQQQHTLSLGGRVCKNITPRGCLMLKRPTSPRTHPPTQTLTHMHTHTYTYVRSCVHTSPSHTLTHTHIYSHHPSIMIAVGPDMWVSQNRKENRDKKCMEPNRFGFLFLILLSWQCSFSFAAKFSLHSQANL